MLAPWFTKESQFQTPPVSQCVCLRFSFNLSLSFSICEKGLMDGLKKRVLLESIDRYFTTNMRVHIQITYYFHNQVCHRVPWAEGSFQEQPRFFFINLSYYNMSKFFKSVIITASVSGKLSVTWNKTCRECQFYVPE